ncbi:hypothetical protein QYE76_041814 [Lolium multiflorum]|uniref:Uncharacterized protein n=1 Tax=Lolium multiflorum TaxID=4521 RepID=A0AAD8TG39_LOLMU|nr:hypothetical protein QYE76_041814 [Lolium multiflorum]
MGSSDPTDIEDTDRGVDGGDELVESVKPAERSIDDDMVDPAADGDGFLADLGTKGSSNRRTPSALTLQWTLLNVIPKFPCRPEKFERDESLCGMEPFIQTEVYQLGNGGDMIFERDLHALSEFLGRSPPEFYGGQVNDQPGGQLQWVIMADLPRKPESPMFGKIQFSLRENNWADGLARAMQEALARLDNSRAYANHTYLQLAQQAETIKVIAKERRALRRLNAKKDYTIHRLKAKIAALKETVATQAEQLQELEEEGEGEDIQGDGYSYVGNDDDYEEEEDEDLAFHPNVDGYEHLEAGMDNTFPINVDGE